MTVSSVKMFPETDCNQSNESCGECRDVEFWGCFGVLLCWSEGKPFSFRVSVLMELGKKHVFDTWRLE